MSRPRSAATTLGALVAASVLQVVAPPPALAAGYAAAGEPQQYVVPAGVTAVRVRAYGASGAAPGGGLGSYVSAILPVTPGETLWIRVGGAGAGAAGGWNGGGAGGNAEHFDAGGGGGGATDVRRGVDDLAHRVLVAGGGGGASAYGSAGGGGDTRGEDGTYVCYECGVRPQPNAGDRGPGPYSAGTGSRGLVSNDTDGSCVPVPPGSGVPGRGGDGGMPCGSPCDHPGACTYVGGGGGGGGLVGGGAGGTGHTRTEDHDTGGGGGGGSSYVPPAAVGVEFAAAVHLGDGALTIEPV